MSELFNIGPAFALHDVPHRAASNTELASDGTSADRSSKRSNLPNAIRRQLRPNASLHVDHVRDRLQMIWVDAAVVAAQMVRLKAGRDRPSVLLPCNSVGECRPAVALADEAVPTWTLAPQPVPAPRLWVNLVSIGGDPPILFPPMTKHVAYGSAFDPPPPSRSVRRKRGGAPTTAVAPSGRIGFGSGKFDGHVWAPHTSPVCRSRGRLWRRPAFLCIHYTTKPLIKGGELP